MTEITGRVLIVEDQELWREEFFGEILEELGFTTFAAATKEEALDLLNTHDFDLAIIDINLTSVTGNTDGLIVAERLETKGTNTPIIVVSGTDGGFRALRDRSRRVFAEIPKDSFNFDQFVSKVKLAIADSRK